MREASASFYLSDPRLAAYAIGQEPAWLWSADGAQALWANAAGAEIFSAASVDTLRDRRFDSTGQVAQQIQRLATSLSADGKPRLERLTGFGFGPLLRPLVCACSRIALRDDAVAILICGLEPIRPALSVTERVRRLFGDTATALAAYTLAGDLVFATPAAREALQSAKHIAAIGATALAATAMNDGLSAGATTLGPATLWRVGRDAETLLVASFELKAKVEAAETKPAPATPAPPEDKAGAKEIAPAGASDVKANPPATVRRHPLRFVWHLDAQQHFTLTSEEFLDLAGPATAKHNGALWSELCSVLALDPTQQVANAIATQDTWSGIVLSWPTGAGNHIKVELSGLPIFDRQREFTGYRGFGVCRDLAQIEKLMLRLRMEPRQGAAARAAATETSIAAQDTVRPLLSLVPASPNVVPFPATLPDPRAPGLNAGDRKAFSDIAQQLAARLKNNARSDTPRDADKTPPLATSGPGIDGRAPATAEPDHDGASVTGWLAHGATARALLDHLPLGILIYRADELLYANRGFLERVGHMTLEDFAQNGGLDNILLGSSAQPLRDDRSQTISITTTGQKQIQADARLISLPFDGHPARALVLSALSASEGPERASIRKSSHDRSAEKLLEQQIGELRRLADKASADHTDFLKRVGHDIRTPLTAIVGFAEAIMSEDFGPIGNERYRDYLSGIRNAGERILALINELDRQPKGDDVPAVTAAASKETIVDLNAIVQSCVSELQPEASRERVLIRTSLARPLPGVAADVNAVRQIVLNLMTNSIKLAGAGGQVIISTAVNGTGTVSLRLRDTGIGVNESDLAAALRTTSAAGEQSSDAPEGRLKLAVAKALVEANRASLKISSRPNDGTLVEVSFREMTPPAA